MSVLVAALIGAIGMIALADGAAAGLAVHRAQARAGADLSALAAAAAIRVGIEGGSAPSACGAAHLVAQANAVVLSVCAVAGDGTVVVEVRSGVVAARSRAGPAGK